MRRLALGGLVPIALLAAAGPAAASRQPAPPPVHALVSYQLGGPFVPPEGAVVDRDRTAPPAAGHYGICYVNAFQVQPGERRWWRTHHPRLLLTRRHRPVVDRAWREPLLDVSTAAKRRLLLRVVGSWVDGCARAGFDAVEPDNLDSWTRSRGLLTRADDLAFAALLIARAHARGLAIAQKNAAEATRAGRRLGFDFAIAEECQAHRECGAYRRAYGRRVIEVEYVDHGGRATFAAACRARGAEISVVLRDRAVTPAGRPGSVEEPCPAAPG
jgi:Glycoside-hydrolase family GH114